jgi:hypothetical protein
MKVCFTVENFGARQGIGFEVRRHGSGEGDGLVDQHLDDCLDNRSCQFC